MGTPGWNLQVSVSVSGPSYVCKSVHNTLIFYRWRSLHPLLLTLLHPLLTHWVTPTFTTSSSVSSLTPFLSPKVCFFKLSDSVGTMRTCSKRYHIRVYICISISNLKKTYQRSVNRWPLLLHIYRLIDNYNILSAHFLFRLFWLRWLDIGVIPSSAALHVQKLGEVGRLPAAGPSLVRIVEEGRPGMKPASVKGILRLLERFTATTVVAQQFRLAVSHLFLWRRSIYLQ